MQLKKLFWVAAILLAVSLESCNIGKAAEPTQDVNAIYTQAAGTMLAQLSDQLTQTAAAASPTPQASPTDLATFTSLPTFVVAPGTTPFGLGGTPFVFNTPGGALTPLPTLSVGSGTSTTANGCNDAAFTGETVKDGTTFSPGATFTKSWNFTNTGTCTWDEGYQFSFVSGDQMGGKNILISQKQDFIAPGKGQAFNVPMVAPKTAGTYKGYWQMKDDKGNLFGSRVWVSIVVK